MCRLVLFAGSCTRCDESLDWPDLSQQLSCLEAKNLDTFGACRRGVDVETHAFDQECDDCAGEDEGVAELESGGEQPQQQQCWQNQHQQQQQVAAGPSITAQGPSKRGFGRDQADARKAKRARA